MAWIEYISEEYRRKRSVQINAERMYSEMKS
jgi:hypothetical protein